MIVKHLTNKDTINFVNLEEKSHYADTNVYRYTLNGCKDIEVLYSDTSQVLKIKGSFLYFKYGHNFVTTRKGFIDAVQSVENSLGIQLGDAFVDELEYGAFMEVPGSPSNYIRNHKPLPCAKLAENQRPRDKGKLKWFEDSFVSLKMYDAKANFAKKLSKDVKEELLEYGWNPDANYLKFEAHYKKPHWALNKGKGIRLQELLTPQWESRLKADLMGQYKRLFALERVFTTDRSTAGILMCSFVNAGVSSGISPEETRKMIYQALRSSFTPEFSPNDIKARQAQLRKLFRSLTPIAKSPWDLTEVLDETLDCQ